MTSEILFEKVRITNIKLFITTIELYIKAHVIMN